MKNISTTQYKIVSLLFHVIMLITVISFSTWVIDYPQDTKAVKQKLDNTNFHIGKYEKVKIDKSLYNSFLKLYDCDKKVENIGISKNLQIVIFLSVGLVSSVVSRILFKFSFGVSVIVFILFGFMSATVYNYWEASQLSDPRPGDGSGCKYINKESNNKWLLIYNSGFIIILWIVFFVIILILKSENKTINLDKIMAENMLLCIFIVIVEIFIVVGIDNNYSQISPGEINNKFKKYLYENLNATA